MIKFIRRIFRLLMILFWMLFWGLVLIPVSLCHSKWTAIRKISSLAGCWARGLLWILNIHLSIHGNRTQCSHGLVVSNHMGPIDILVHSAVFGLRFCPNNGIRKWPFLGWFVALSRPIWIDRASRLSSQKNLQEFQATLEHRISLIIYPEGTSTDGKRILPFKTSPFELAASGSFPIEPIVTLYRVPEGEDSPCWYTDISILAHLHQLLGISRVDCDVYLLPEICENGKNRKELAELTRQVILEAHQRYSAKEEKTEK